MLDGASSGLDVPQSIQVLAISLGLGGLVGLQRQQAESHIAGIRTFPLITVLGTIAGLVAKYDVTLGACLIVVCMVGVIAASGLGNYIRARLWIAPDPTRSDTGSGITTEMAILVMYAVGVFLVFGPAVVAISVTGVVVLLLYAKDLLHRFVSSLGEKDVHAIMQFVLLAFVVLPILPDRTFGLYHVLNPRQIWLVVVLVVGISLGGYVIYKVVGERAGTVLSGLLGGLISSTATTASFARRAKDGNGGLTSAAMLAIMLASTVVYARLFVEVSAVAPTAVIHFAGPLITMGAVTALITVCLYLMGLHNKDTIPAQENPTSIKSALFFATIYAGVVLASAAAQQHLGASGLYVVAAVSGLSDMDAITISSGRAVADGRLAIDEAWRAVLIALMSSMVMKVLICGALGSRRLFLRAVLIFAINIAAGIIILLFWPKS